MVGSVLVTSVGRRVALAAKKQAVRAAARRAREAAEREVDAQHEANACAELDSSGSEQRAATPPRPKKVKLGSG